MSTEKILFTSRSTLCRKNSVVFTVLFLLCVPFFWLLCVTLRHSVADIIMLTTTILITIGSLMLLFVCIPHKFILTNTHFIIKRRLKDSVIPLQNIKEIRLVSPAERKRLILNNLAMFGHRGFLCHYPTKYKKIIMYSGHRRDNWTLLFTDRGKFLIAPNDLQLIDATMQQIRKNYLNNQNIE